MGLNNGTAVTTRQSKGASHAPADNTIATCEMSAEVGLVNKITHLSMSLDEGETTGVLVTLTNVKGTSGAVTLTWYLPAGASLSIDPPDPIVANAANLAMVLATAQPGASQQSTVQVLGYTE